MEFFFYFYLEYEFKGFTDCCDVILRSSKYLTNVWWSVVSEECELDSDEDGTADFLAHDHHWLLKFPLLQGLLTWNFSSPIWPINMKGKAGFFQLFYTDDVVTMIVMEMNS